MIVFQTRHSRYLIDEARCRYMRNYTSFIQVPASERLLYDTWLPLKKWCLKSLVGREGVYFALRIWAPDSVKGILTSEVELVPR